MENVIEVRLIEVRYAGVVVGRSTKVRDWGASGAFIGFAEPLPSGTSLVLRGDGVDQAARVVEVFESADPAVAGMQVTFVGAAEAARPTPKPAAAAPNPAPVPAPEAKLAAPIAEAAPPSVTVAEAAPVEASNATSSAVSGEPSGPAPSEQGDGQGGTDGQGGSDGQGGQAGLDGQAGQGGGKRRRRRR